MLPTISLQPQFMILLLIIKRSLVLRPMTCAGGTPVTGKSGVKELCKALSKVSIPRPIVCDTGCYTYNLCNITDRIPEISYTVVFGIVKSLRGRLAVFRGKPLKSPDQPV
jgi:hypothetical protein